MLGDGHLGIWAGLRNVYPDAKEQRCWNHRIVNALDKVPKRLQAHARRQLTQIHYAATQQEAERLKAGYQHWCRTQGLEAAATVLDRDWERMVTFYQFPREHWKHLRTSNVVESPFSRVRLRTTASRRFKSQVNATCLIWKTLMVAEMSFRKLDAPELVAKVVDGTQYEDGEEIQKDRDAA